MQSNPSPTSTTGEIVSALQAARNLVSKSNQFSASKDTVVLQSSKNAFVQQDVSKRLHSTKQIQAGRQISWMNSASSLQRTLKPEYYQSHRSTNCESPKRSEASTFRKNSIENRNNEFEDLKNGAMQQEYNFDPQPRDSNESLPMPTPYYSARDTPTGSVDGTHVATDTYSDIHSNDWSPIKKGSNTVDVREPSPDTKSMPVQQRAAAATAQLHQRMRNRIADALHSTGKSSSANKSNSTNSSKKGSGGGEVWWG